MESTTNNKMVGLIVLVLIFGLLTAALWLSIGFEKHLYDTYIVYMDEAVSGLSEQSIVKYNGVKVGYVDNIQLSRFDPQKVRILIKVEAGTPVTVSTHATLIFQGITGTTYMGLSADTPSILPLQRTKNEPYPVIPSTPSFINQLEKNVNDISEGIKRVFDTENAAIFSRTLKNLQEISDIFARNGDNFDKTLQSLPEVLHEFKESALKFNRMTNNMTSTSQQVNDTMKSAQRGIQQISQQALPPAILLLRRLDVIASNLEQVSMQLRQNPSVMIRGNTKPKPGPGE